EGLACATYSNLGVSGMSMAGGNKFSAPGGLYQTIPWGSFKLFTIAFGTNDYGGDVPIGNISDTTNATFYGAWNIVLDAIFTVNPLIKIILITPFQRVTTSPNAAGHVLLDYVDAIQKIGEKYSCPVIDAYRNS